MKKINIFLIVIILIIFFNFYPDYINKSSNYYLDEGYIENKFIINENLIRYKIPQQGFNYIIDKKLITLYLLIFKYSKYKEEYKYSFENKIINKIFENYIDKITYNINDNYLSKFSEFFNQIKLSRNKSIIGHFVNDYISYRVFYYSFISNDDKIFLSKSEIDNEINENFGEKQLKKLLVKYEDNLNNSKLLIASSFIHSFVYELDELITIVYEQNKKSVDKISNELKIIINKQINYYIFNLLKNNFYNLLSSDLKIYYFLPMNWCSTSDFVSLNNASFSKYCNMILIPLFETKINIKDNIESYIHELLHFYYYNKLYNQLNKFVLENCKNEIINYCLNDNKLEYFLPINVNPALVNYIPIIKIEDIINYKPCVKVYFENEDQFINKFILEIFDEFFAYLFTQYIIREIYKNNDIKDFIFKNYPLILPDESRPYFVQYKNIFELQYYYINNHPDILKNIIFENNFPNLLILFKSFVYAHKIDINNLNNIIESLTQK